jgi:hypothetical protein
LVNVVWKHTLSPRHHGHGEKGDAAGSKLGVGCVSNGDHKENQGKCAHQRIDREKDPFALLPPLLGPLGLSLFNDLGRVLALLIHPNLSGHVILEGRSSTLCTRKWEWLVILYKSPLKFNICIHPTERAYSGKLIS